jgi:hypothetical protein
MSKKTKSTKPWSGKDAEQWMAVAHMSGKRGVKGLCLKTCRQAWQISVWSTDLPIKDTVGRIYYTEVEKAWGSKYLGWTTQLNGVDLYV